MTKVLKIIVGLVLGAFATWALFNANDSHVNMCMVGAIVFSLGLIISVFTESEGIKKLVSFAGGWIFFYTIIAATSYLIYEWLTGQGNEGPLSLSDPVFYYHFLINFVILMIFWLKLEKPSVFTLGFIIALLASPLMLVQYTLFGWEPFMESTLTIIIYVIVGLILLVIFFGFCRNWFSEPGNLEKFNKIIKAVLWIYIIVMIATLVIVYLF